MKLIVCSYLAVTKAEVGEGTTDVGDGARGESGKVPDGLHSGDRPLSL